MKRLVLILAAAFAAALGMSDISEAQTTYTSLNGPTCADGNPCATSTALAAISASVPQPSSATPNSPAPTPSSGSAVTYLRGDTTIAALCRRTTVTSAADGSFSVTWTTPLSSSTPWGHVEPIYTGSMMPPVCWMKSINSAGIVGQCAPTQTTGLTLSLVTAGVTVSPFGANTGASGLTVKVSGCEPTQ